MRPDALYYCSRCGAVEAEDATTAWDGRGAALTARSRRADQPVGTLVHTEDEAEVTRAR